MVAKVLKYDATAIDSLLDKVHRASSHYFRQYRRGAIIRCLKGKLVCLDAKAKIYKKNGRGEHV